MERKFLYRLAMAGSEGSKGRVVDDAEAKASGHREATSNQKSHNWNEVAD